MYKLILSAISMIWLVVLFAIIKVELRAESERKIPSEKWTCTQCDEENPFWYSLCGACGKFYW